MSFQKKVKRFYGIYQLFYAKDIHNPP